MSVDFSTVVGYGYILSPNIADKLIEDNEEICDYMRYIDSYSDNSDRFLGIVIKTLDPGEYFHIIKFIVEEGIEYGQKLIEMLDKLNLNTEHPIFSDPQVCIYHRVS